MNENQLDFLNAQEIQGPAIEVSSEWLAVGHIDEIFLFLKRNQGPGNPWVVAIASPALARQRLQQAYDAGYGDAAVFEGRGDHETTVQTLLFNDYLMGFNDLAQARIDSIREILQTQLDLTDDDFLDLPVLFENFDGSGQAVALNPGVQNLVDADSILFVPDPEGPIINGQDLWQVSTRNALAPLGYEVRFVDVFYSYHVLMGEAHCGSNFERAPSPLNWWEEEE
jgi:protein-arginine deiminase